MNVLVYSGEGASLECIKHTMDLLRLHLEPFYSVQTITKDQLFNEPWYDTTKSKMLVFPGGYDTPYNDLLLQQNSKIKKLILNKFRNGIFLGICAGGYLGADSIEFDIPTQHLKFERPLKFFPGLAKGPAFTGFNYNDNSGARVAKLRFKDESSNVAVETNGFFNGGACFVDADKYEDVEVLATFEEKLDLKDSDGKRYPAGQAAAVLCQPKTAANLKAILMSPHLEYIPKLLELTNKTKPNSYAKEIISLTQNECDSRDLFWKQILQKVGLKVNMTTKSAHFGEDLTLTPHYVHFKHQSVSTRITPEKDYKFYQFEHDAFQVFKGYQNSEVEKLHQSRFNFDVDEIPKSIVFPSNEAENQASFSFTPFFDSKKFFSYLNPKNRLADVLVLSEKTTSTSSLLDSNPSLMKKVFGTESVCNVSAVQLKGKGRSGNAWVSPKGLLASTTSFDFPEGLSDLKVFYLQYIGAFAMCDALRQYFDPFSQFNNGTDINKKPYGEIPNKHCQIPVVIKWPNDLYILNPSYYHTHFAKSGLTLEEFIETSITAPIIDNSIFTKVSGVLVNLKYTSKWQILFGVGVNVFNRNPNPCIQDWVEIIQSHYDNIPNLEFEKIEARFLNCLDIFLANFLLFDKEAVLKSFLKNYYKYWLHSNQTVTLKDYNNARCEIIGISSDYGFLEAKDKQTGHIFQLKPDGNSFNIFEGLISNKVV